MPNTIETQTLLNGSRILVVKVHIDGDGSGDETNTKMIDASLYGANDIKIMAVQAAFTGFSAELIWDGTPNTHAFNVPDYDVNQDFRDYGGLWNDAAAKTGDILISTVGLGSGDTGHIILQMEKRNT